ncbi:hypothetical protein ACS0TY_026600 [Phlomoides rotata]
MKAGKRTMGSKRVSNGNLKRECKKSCRVLISMQLLTLTPKSMCEKKITIDIFGKDRATGEHVVYPIDIVIEMLQRTVEQEGETGVKTDVVNTDDNEVDENTSVAQPS